MAGICHDKAMREELSMVVLYREVKFLLKKMRELRGLDESEYTEWAKTVGPEWIYLHQPHY
jgi:hypothetical protein